MSIRYNVRVAAERPELLNTGGMRASPGLIRQLKAVIYRYAVAMAAIAAIATA